VCSGNIDTIYENNAVNNSEINIYDTFFCNECMELPSTSSKTICEHFKYSGNSPTATCKENNSENITSVLKGHSTDMT
jgi:hypothetical protein